MIVLQRAGFGSKNVTLFHCQIASKAALKRRTPKWALLIQSRYKNSLLFSCTKQ